MAHRWNYRRYGPDKWDFCRAVKYSQLGQSPIDIETGECQRSVLPRLRIDFKRDRCSKITNNGHSVQVSLRGPDDIGDPAQYSVRRGPLGDERYVLDNFHFHWGRHDDEGSEHTIDGSPAALEGHFVCYNMKYGSLREAQDKRDGLCVLAVLYKVGRPNRYLQELLDKYFGEIGFKGRHKEFDDIFHPKNLIPRRRHRQKFWHYHGSLTTPPCFESVDWIVFQKFGHVSPEQLAMFRALHSYCPNCGRPDSDDENEGRMTHNFRPTQPRRFIARSEDGDGDEVDRVVGSYCRRYRRTGAFRREDDDPDSSDESSSSSEDEDSSDGGDDDSE